MLVSFVLVYARSVTQRYRQRRAWKVSFCHYGNTGNSLMIACAPTIDESQWKRWKSNYASFFFSFVKHFTECFKHKDSMLNTSAITAVTTKSSMKPRSSATTNHHLCRRGERNGEQSRTKVSFGRTMMQALELLWLMKRHVSGWSDAEQWRNQAHSPSGYWVMLVWKRQSVR